MLSVTNARTTLNNFLNRSTTGPEVRETFDRYAEFHDSGDSGSRSASYATMVNAYYDLVTDLYEYGWGESFHFAPRYHGESFEASLARHQFLLAHHLRLSPDAVVLDAGCGVGGPARAIARFCGAKILGINNNPYQVERARILTHKAGLGAQCRFEIGDFMKLAQDDGHFEAAFAIESTAHAPDKSACFAEIFRVLAPGALFGGYEWCLTSRYDPASAAHRTIKAGIEKGNGLPDIASVDQLEHALVEAGFEIVGLEDRSLCSDPRTPWYLPLSSSGLRPRELLTNPVGRWCTHQAIGVLQAAGLVADGMQEVTRLLNDAAHWLAEGGRTGIFTPMLLFQARKPG